MHLVNLSDHLYRQAAQRAAALGFVNVDDYVAHLVATRIAAGKRTDRNDEVREYFAEKPRA